jgi:putative cell wall-binding protein
VSKAAFPSASTAYVAYGFDFPDALGAAAAAAFEDAPVLLVAGDSVPSATRTELVRLGPSEIVVVGGPGVVSDAVLADLQAAVPAATVVRRWGADRFATAAAVSIAVFGSASAVYVAYGFDFPDALGAAAAAGAAGAPVLLVAGDSLPSATRTELVRLGPSEIVVVGGSAVISHGVQADLGRFVD